jgi:hypothetical protein
MCPMQQFPLWKIKVQMVKRILRMDGLERIFFDFLRETCAFRKKNGSSAFLAQKIKRGLCFGNLKGFRNIIL